jgi:uncharacterized protein (DUF433 family)
MREDFIVSDPQIMGGTPCIKGTRLTVHAVKARIRGGESVAELFTGYPPEFGEDHVRAAIDYADRVPFSEAPDGRPWRSARAKQSAA